MGLRFVPLFACSANLHPTAANARFARTITRHCKTDGKQTTLRPPPPLITYQLYNNVIPRAKRALNAVAAGIAAGPFFKHFTHIFGNRFSSGADYEFSVGQMLLQHRSKQILLSPAQQKRPSQQAGSGRPFCPDLCTTIFNAGDGAGDSEAGAAGSLFSDQYR